eukprot:20884-Heterococcus_DN1.PRE.3
MLQVASQLSEVDFGSVHIAGSVSSKQKLFCRHYCSVAFWHDASAQYESIAAVFVYLQQLKLTH